MKKIILSLTLSFILALIAYLKKAMTMSALILAFIFSCLITYYGGLNAFIILASVFIINQIAGQIKKEYRDSLTKDVNVKIHQKDLMEIIANVGMGTISIVIYGLTNNNIFLIIYAAIMAESLADSLASDIGILSKKAPINILTLKRSKPGLSGNISFLGLFSSLLGSFLISLIFIIPQFNLTNMIIITLSGFLGAILDSLIGALFQIKYKCPKCGIITEQKSHCKTPTQHYQGFKFLDNDLVNLISNFFSGFLAYIFLLIF